MEVWYCDECGDRVTAIDIERGWGVKTSNQVFCRKCQGKRAEHVNRSAITHRGANRERRCGQEPHRSRRRGQYGDALDEADRARHGLVNHPGQ